MKSKPRDNRPYVGIQIFGHYFEALLDTGASISTIGNGMEDFLYSLDRSLFSATPTMRVSVADGAKQTVLGSVKLPVVFDHRCYELHFAVIPSIAHPVILGIDFCKLFGITLDFLNLSYEIASHQLADDSTLTDVQRQELESVIADFRELSSDAPGRTDLIEHYIDTGDAKPFKQRQFPFSPALQAQLHKEIDTMLAQGVIEPSTSPWSSPIIMVKKKDGSYRMCFDGRKLNEVTVKDSYPLPLIDSILSKLGECNYMTSIDLSKAFWNLPLEKSSRPKTAFQVHGKGLFQFKVMPFGLCNSPKTLQRLMDRILGPEFEPHVFTYLDDIILVSKDFEAHLRLLREVCARLKAAKLAVNFDKCQFCRDSLSFLGFVIDKQGLRTDPAKIESIINTPSPKNTTEVRRLIGIMQWYRRFIPDFSTISEPITSLIHGKKKGSSIVWTEQAEVAFQTLKQLLVSAPILRSPCWDQPFYVQTDASDVGIGAVLYQLHDGFEHPIAYASRKLTKAEQKYTVTEKECLAVLFGVEKYRGYIEGTHFFVITDHASLKWLFSLKDPIGRLARWTTRLSQFDFELHHRKGNQNVVADFLSRHIFSIEVENFTHDEWYTNMIQKVNNFPEKYPDFRVENNTLLKHIRPTHNIDSNLSDWKIVVPTANRKEILEACHDSPLAGHFGVFKTTARISERYYWPGLRKDVRYFVKTCKICGAYKKPSVLKAGLMGRAKQVDFPFQNISLDLMGPFPRSKKGNTQLLVVTDWFTKFILVQPIPKATSKNVIKFLENQVFLLFGVPQTIMCDNGVQFTSTEFKSFLKKYSVQKVWYNARYHPQVNPTERVNRVIGTALASFIRQDHKTWDEEVYKIAQAIRTSVHEVTGFSPAFLVFGRNVPVDGSYYGKVPDNWQQLSFADKQKWCSDLQKLPEVYNKVQTKLHKSYQTNANRYNLRRRPIKYQVGDKVWKSNFVLSDAAANFSKKLAPKYIPAVIHKVLGTGLVYELVDLEGKPLGAFHVQDLKPYYERENLSLISHQINKDNVSLSDARKIYQKWKNQMNSPESNKTIIETTQDLFTVSKDFSLAHCVASDMKMSAGIAVEFRERFNHARSLQDLKISPGGLAILKNNTRYLYYLVTKQRSHQKPTYFRLCQSLLAMRKHMLKHQVDRLAIPLLGCGLDQLKWNKVRRLISTCFEDSGITILVCRHQ